MSEIGDKIKGYRKAKGMSQLYLAEAVGSRQQSLSFIESGKTIPRETVINNLARVLELSVEERRELLELISGD